MSTTTTEAPKQDEVLERLQRLVERAEGGDESVMPELRAALNANPWVWERYGDLAQQSMAAWLQLIAGSNLLLQESTRRKAEQLRAELAGPAPSPLERLLVERVVACWLQTNYADAAYAQLKGTNPAQHTTALRRADRRAASEARRAEDARWREALAPLMELSRVADLVARAALLAAGYHRHSRSSWRKKRYVHDSDRGPEARRGP